MYIYLTVVIDDAIANEVLGAHDHGEHGRRRRPERSRGEPPPLGRVQRPRHAGVDHDARHPAQALAASAPSAAVEKRLQPRRHGLRHGGIEPDQVVAVLAVVHPVRDPHQPQAPPAFSSRRASGGFHDAAVVELGVDEGDGEAPVEEAVGELHERDNVALGRVGEEERVRRRGVGGHRSQRACVRPVALDLSECCLCEPSAQVSARYYRAPTCQCLPVKAIQPPRRRLCRVGCGFAYPDVAVVETTKRSWLSVSEASSIGRRYRAHGLMWRRESMQNLLR
jgi:hypothetical protein